MDNNGLTPLTDKQLEAAAKWLLSIEGRAPEWRPFPGAHDNLTDMMNRLRTRDLETIALSAGRAEFPHD